MKRRIYKHAYKPLENYIESLRTRGETTAADLLEVVHAKRKELLDENNKLRAELRKAKRAERK